jgi:hypothetical protein
MPKKPALKAPQEALEPTKLSIDYVALDKLVKWPRNPKSHNQEALNSAFEKFGYIDPIIIDETTGRIVSGHGRLDVLKQMQDIGIEPPKRIIIEDGAWQVPVLRGIAFDSEAQAEGYLVAANQLVIAGGFDRQILSEVLADLKEDGTYLDALGFGEGEIEKILKGIDAPAEFPEYDSNLPTNHECPSCKYSWSGPCKSAND